MDLGEILGSYHDRRLHYRKEGIILFKGLNHGKVDLEDDPSSVMCIEMMKYAGTDDYDIPRSEIEGNVIAIHGVFTFERHDYLYRRMPVIGVFFIIGIVVKKKGRIIFETDRFLYSVEDLYHFLPYPLQIDRISVKELLLIFAKKMIQ